MACFRNGMQQGPLWGYLSKEGAVEKYWEAGSVGEEEVGEAPGTLSRSL